METTNDNIVDVSTIGAGAKDFIPSLAGGCLGWSL